MLLRGIIHPCSFYSAVQPPPWQYRGVFATVACIHRHLDLRQRRLDLHPQGIVSVFARFLWFDSAVSASSVSCQAVETGMYGMRRCLTAVLRAVPTH